MSEEHYRILGKACRILQGTFKDLGDLFEESSEKLATEGAKHKSKAAEKDAAKLEKLQETVETSKSAEETKKDKKAKKKASKEKNGDGLKRPPSAYMLYNNYRRPVLRTENPKSSLPDISRVIGAEWNNMSEEQQKVWKDKSREQRLEYDIKNFNLKQKLEGQASNAEAAPKQIQSQPTTEAKPHQASPSKNNAKNDSLSSFTSENDNQVDNHMNTVSQNKKQQQVNENSSSDLE